MSFDGPATSERYFGVQFFLEDLLGRPVDLVTDKRYAPNSSFTSSEKPSVSDPTTQREWPFYVDDMIDFAERVITYTEGLNQTEFIASGLNYDATLRNLELIGEAAHPCTG